MNTVFSKVVHHYYTEELLKQSNMCYSLVFHDTVYLYNRVVLDTCELDIFDGL